MAEPEERPRVSWTGDAKGSFDVQDHPTIRTWEDVREYIRARRVPAVNTEDIHLFWAEKNEDGKTVKKEAGRPLKGEPFVEEDFRRHVSPVEIFVEIPREAAFESASKRHKVSEASTSQVFQNLEQDIWRKIALQLVVPPKSQVIDGANHSFLELPEAAPVLRTPPLANQPRLFIRRCYDDLADMAVTARKRSRFLVMGTPGIGKSTFLLYVARKFLLLGRQVVLDVLAKPGQVLLTPKVDAEGHVVDVVEKSIEASALQDNKAVYVSDKEAPFSAFAGVSVVGHSPSLAEKGQYRNESDKLYMPGWDVDELRACWKILEVTIDETTFETLHSLWGGNPRYVFKEQDKSTTEFKALLASISPKRTSEIVRLFGGELGFDDKAVHRLVRYDSQKPFVEATRTAASDKVREWLYDRLRKEPAEVYREAMTLLRDANMATEYGKLFEYVNHKKFLDSAGHDLTWLLLPPHARYQRHDNDERTQQVFKIPAPLHRSIFFKLPDKLLVNTYYTPIDKNFVAVDGFILVQRGQPARCELILFQDTIGGSHDIKVKGLEKCIACAPSNTPVHYVFRIPTARIGDWTHAQIVKGDSSTLPADIPQYVWGIDMDACLNHSASG